MYVVKSETLKLAVSTAIVCPNKDLHKADVMSSERYDPKANANANPDPNCRPIKESYFVAGSDVEIVVRTNNEAHVCGVDWSDFLSQKQENTINQSMNQPTNQRTTRGWTEYKANDRSINQPTSEPMNGIET